MAQTGYTPIQLYYSTTASAVPTAGNLAPGELGLNIADMKLYCENSSGTVTLLASAAGASGDVVASANNAFTGANTFYNNTGQTFGTSTSTQDGLILAGRAGGSGSFRITLQPTTLSSSTVLNLPNVNDTVAVLGTSQTFTAPQVISVNSGSDALRITQVGSGNALVVEDSANPDLTSFIINSDGNVGIGATPFAAVKLDVERSASEVTAAGSTSTLVYSYQEAQAATSTGIGFFSVQGASSTSTTSTLSNFYASQAAFGAGAAVQNQFGFLVDNSLISGITNFGFYSNIASGTGRWNFFANGTANNALVGDTRFGSTTAPTATVDVTGTAIITANSSSDALRITQVGAGNALVVEDSANPDSTPFVIDSNGTVIVGTTTSQPIAGSGYTDLQVNGTTGSNGITISRWTATALSSAPFFGFKRSRGATIGTAGIVQSGDTIGALNFYGDDGVQGIVAAGIQAFVDGTPGTNDMPGRLVFYTTADGASSLTERMRIDSAGRIGFGSASLGGASGGFRFSGNITGATSSSGLLYTPTIQSDVTTNANVFLTQPTTQDAAFTLANLYHFHANIGTITGGSRTAPTNQYGFHASSALTGATNNYGFYSSIASGTGRWNFYAAGTADNYFAGKVGVGALPFSDTSGISIGSSITGGTAQNAINIFTTVQSDVTNIARGYYSHLGTAVASFTLSNLQHFVAEQRTLGVGSAVTNQYGFVANPTLTGATNNYGFFSNIASGTGRWNFYANGTAANYFAGDMQLDKTVTAAGTTGAQTINKNAGTVNFAAAATSLVVTNNRVTANSIIICTVGTNDTTMKSVSAVAGAGSFTLHANAAATAETRVNFLIIN